jgi:hypothetical protein
VKVYFRGVPRLGTWRNWQTRTLQVRMSQDMEVQVLSCPLVELADLDGGSV